MVFNHLAALKIYTDLITQISNMNMSWRLCASQNIHGVPLKPSNVRNGSPDK